MGWGVQRAGLLVLALGLPGCGSQVATSPAAGEPWKYAEEAARTDLVCSDDADVGEAREPFSYLTLACLVAVGVGVHIGCSRGLLEAYCPAGTHKVIHDIWNGTKTLTIECDVLQAVVCGTGAVAAGELMRKACTAVP